jgi:hypothetical protein
MARVVRGARAEGEAAKIFLKNPNIQRLIRSRRYELFENNAQAFSLHDVLTGEILVGGDLVTQRMLLHLSAISLGAFRIRRVLFDYADQFLVQTNLLAATELSFHAWRKAKLSKKMKENEVVKTVTSGGGDDENQT